jgi:dsRNA-specific ribonuclease
VESAIEEKFPNINRRRATLLRAKKVEAETIREISARMMTKSFRNIKPETEQNKEYRMQQSVAVQRLPIRVSLS